MSDRARDLSAVVVRTRPLRESDLVVILLTSEQGKLACVARGARKSRKRFAGGLPVGAIGEARVSPGRGSMSVLEGFVPQRDHGALGRDLELFAYVAYLCELADELSVEGDRDATLFAILVEALELSLNEGPDPARLRAFELRLLATLGLLPELERCAVCGDDLVQGESIPFDLERGGALCLAHGAGGRPTRSATLELARELLQDGGKRALQARGLPPMVRRELRDICSGLLRRQLRRPLRSLEFFKQVQALSRGTGAPVKGEPEGE